MRKILEFFGLCYRSDLIELNKITLDYREKYLKWKSNCEKLVLEPDSEDAILIDLGVRVNYDIDKEIWEGGCGQVGKFDGITQIF